MHTSKVYYVFIHLVPITGNTEIPFPPDLPLTCHQYTMTCITILFCSLQSVTSVHSTASREEMDAVVALADIGFSESSFEHVDNTEMPADEEEHRQQLPAQQQQHQQQQPERV